MDLEAIYKFLIPGDISFTTGGLLLAIVCCSLFMLIHGIAKWYGLHKNSPPGPAGLPIVGYLPFMGKEPHKTFWNLRKKYGDVISVYMGPKYTVILNDYNSVKEILCNPAALDRAPDLFSHLGDIGFISENGEKWIEQRRYCLSISRDLGLGRDHWEELIMEETTNFIKNIQDLKGKPADISHILASSVTSNIISLLIGRRLTKDEVDIVQLSIDYSDVAFTYMGPSNPTSVVPGLRNVCEVFKIAGYDKAMKVIRQFSSFIREEINRHKTSPVLKDARDFINSYLDKLSELAETKSKNHYFSERMLKGNLAILFLGASDTIFSSLGWLFRLMCEHKDIQEKVHAELMETIGKDGRTRYDERHKVPYTFAVLMEAQRYASNVPLSTTRKTNQDIHIDGYVIPKGSEIIANLWALHHDPAYWDEPEQFRPERFLTDGGTKLAKNSPSYAPFSIGRRNCPGETIAWMEILFYFSETLKNFEISTPPRVKPEFNIINGLVARLAPQELCFKKRKILLYATTIKIMELEKNNAYFNFNNATLIISSFTLIISIYAFFTLLRSILRWYKLWQKRPPGPVGLPFVGYLPFLGNEPHKTLWNLRNKYGNIISVYLGPKYTVVLNEYKVAKEVLSHPGSLDRAPDLFSHLGDIGFVAENGERWLEQRRFTMSTAKDLGLGKDYWEILIMEEVSSLIEKLHELKGKPFDISEDLTFSLNTSILSLVIGRRLGKDEIDKIHLCADYADAAITKMGPSNPASLVPGLRKVCEIFKIADYDKSRKIIHQFSSFMKGEIKRHKTSELFRDIPDFINSYLQKLSEMTKIKSKDHAFSETMLEGNLALLFLGASDTVFSSLGWLFRIMCKHKDIQEKVHTELMEVLGKDGRARYEERDKIPYTFAVLMEGQRYASNVPLSTTRKANQDIPVNGYIIPKGSEITTNLWALHHDPDYWDEPNEFRPERFLIDGGTKLIKNPPSYAPFSIGRRNCPGETIAWMEILYYFAEILKRFEISTPPAVEPKFEVISGLVTRLVPQPMCFKERNV
ncbi:uncharacterized protein LOC129971749 [Argiope bruennichi]|uniref:uncharacterized protein LOC129971749 n=1 Tax=Argiope bruennichi TaxID=94029 RepID=UPI002495A5E7|nr:uncharacterized protein LOC129971749 [Argiope bruennichi]